ncbi:MAG: ParB/RepB/Spo0J family partition protein [Candidatus Doudnabacteria bacterium]|nr:ParB/RepB/Spo0J family partition protein [Candidatus Doudnabacteria bacterium]
MDDKFKLGNFDGLEEIEDLGGLSLRGDSIQSRGDEAIPNEIAVRPSNARNDINTVIKHPTARADRQAKFKDRDGRPLMEIELAKIVPNEFQPRRIFNEEKLGELAASIKEHGIIQPLVVVARDDGKYEIVVGERRFRAAKLAGLAKVPVFVHPKINSEAKLEFALIENIQRADLNPIEEGKAFERLNREFGLSLTEIAKRVSKDISTISNLIRLLSLPVEVQRALIEGKIAEGQARPLLSLKDKEEMLQMFKIILRDQMKVRDIEAKVREIKTRKIKVKEMFTPDPFLESLENLLRNKLGTRVEVSKAAKGGKITIEFYSDEELNDIVSKIT